jgi:hypothetical protein
MGGSTRSRARRLGSRSARGRLGRDPGRRELPCVAAGRTGDDHRAAGGGGGTAALDDELGNRAQKPDLEAIVALDTRVVIFGSGSTPLRQSIVVAKRDGTVELFDGSALYDAARGRPELAGTTLNIEGALVRDGALYWFQRGNGGAEERPLNAVVELDLGQFEAWLGGGPSTPAARAVRIVELGDVDGVPLGFTDATMVAGQTLFVAVAEASPGVAHDGRVTGVRLGRLGVQDLELAMVMEADGIPSRRKLEGIWPHPERSGALLAVADADDANRAAELCEVRLPVEWRGATPRLNGSQMMAWRR